MLVGMVHSSEWNDREGEEGRRGKGNEMRRQTLRKDWNAPLNDVVCRLVKMIEEAAV